MTNTQPQNEATAPDGAGSELTPLLGGDLTGLCVNDEQRGRTANIHQDGGEVYYGLYVDARRSDPDNGCCALLRTQRRDMEAMIYRAWQSGASIYTLLDA